MKKLHLWALSGLLISVAVLSPSMALANTSASATGGAAIAGDGTVRVWGAQVTEVSGNIISAVSTFGNKLFSWVVNISADTEVKSVDEAGVTASTTAEIKEGDRVAFVGALTSLGATASVAADTVVELATTTKKHFKEKHKDKHKEKKGEHAHKDKDEHEERGEGWSLGLWHHFLAKVDR